MKMNNEAKPPRWPRRILESYCPPDAIEDLLGDMDEIFYTNLKSMSLAKARRKYWRQMVGLLFSYALRKRRNRHKYGRQADAFHGLAMLRSYYTMARRSLVKQKIFSIINLICLSVGMSVGLLALAAYMDYRHVDNFHVNKNEIYRVVSRVDNKDRKLTYASSSAPLASRLADEGTGIAAMTRLNGNFNPEIEMGVNSIPLRGYFADEGFFNMFSFTLKVGEPSTAVTQPFTVVISEETAKKLFGNGEALGETLHVKDIGDFQVTGIVQDHPRSHFNFDILASFSTLASLEKQGIEKSTLQDWGPRTDYYTYIQINNKASRAAIEKELALLAAEHRDPAYTVAYALQPLADIPSGDLYNEIGLVWGQASMAIFFALALLILLPACFNYSNITIARALTRAKEIGLRKVSGGQSSHVFFQLLSETMILSIIALAGAVGIFVLIRAEFLSMIVMGNRTFSLEITPATLLSFIGFALLTGLLAGFFPAFYFSKLNPIETLRNATLSGSLSKIRIRRGLIVLQFALSMVFILGVAIIAKQYRYALTYDLGFQKENILDIDLKNVDGRIAKSELMKLGDVTNVSLSSDIAGNWNSSGVFVSRPESLDSTIVYQMYADENYLSNLALKLVAGSGFDAASTEESIIVNEKFLQTFNIQNASEAIDQDFRIGEQNVRVTGVVKDFNFMPLSQEITNFMFRYDPAQAKYANVKLASASIDEALDKIETVWQRLSAQPFEAKFLDDEVDEALVSFHSMIKIFGFMGFLAITISCLGLLAVVVSAAESRTKEMGIRKIMGASLMNLAYSLSGGFVKLILIAIGIATPITYVLFDTLFLRVQFYRTSIGITEILISIALLFVLVGSIIGSQTWRVARVNPVDTLKHE